MNLLPKGETVNLESLIKYKIVDKNDGQNFGVKILGDGNLSGAYKIELKTSKSAAKKIEKAGGKVISQSQDEEKQPKEKSK